jgi:hypothetical protein
MMTETDILPLNINQNLCLCMNDDSFQWLSQEFCLWEGGLTNSVEDRGQRERGSGGGSPLVGVLEAAVIWYKKFHFI